MIYRLEERAYDDEVMKYTFYTSKLASRQALAVLKKDWRRENRRRAAVRAADDEELDPTPMGAYDLGPYPCAVETFATPTTQRGWMELLEQIASHPNNG